MKAGAFLRLPRKSRFLDERCFSPLCFNDFGQNIFCCLHHVDWGNPDLQRGYDVDVAFVGRKDRTIVIGWDEPELG